MLVDGVQYAEVQRSLERHGLDVAEGVVPELELGIQRGLLVSACVLRLGGRRHGAELVLICSNCYSFLGVNKTPAYIEREL